MNSNLKKRFMSAVAKLTILLMLSNFPMIGLTNSSFTDTEGSVGNTFTAGCWGDPSVPGLTSPADNLTSADYNYTFSWSASRGACPDSIVTYNLEIYLDSSLGTSYYLSGLTSETSLVITNMPEGQYWWRVKAQDQDNYFAYSSVFHLIVNRSPVSTGRVVINEVFYNIDSAHQITGQENKNEWVELYNAGDTAVNVSGWVLADDNSSDFIPTGTPVLEPDHFMVITPDSSTWGYWPSIPSTATKVVLTSTDHKIGNGLENENDRVILRNSSGIEIDAVSWGKKPAEKDTYAFNPAVQNVAEGHSISRFPKGHDTNTAADWMDTHSGSNPVGPNPGTNPHPPITLFTSVAPIAESNPPTDSSPSATTLNPVSPEASESAQPNTKTPESSSSAQIDTRNPVDNLPANETPVEVPPVTPPAFPADLTATETEKPNLEPPADAPKPDPAPPTEEPPAETPPSGSDSAEGSPAADSTE